MVMKNPKQYTGTGTPTEGTVPVATPALTKTSTDIKIQQLEDLVKSQHQQIAKLRRDISRMKSDIGEVISAINNRG